MARKNRPLQVSERLWARALELIPCGTQTMSKGPSSYVEGVFPKYLQKGCGSHVFDVDGNEYIDYILSLGPMSLGHQYPSVVEAVRRQLEEGTTFSLMHPLEIEVAELLVEVIPCAEMVRYAKNGSDVTNAAVKLARVFTGREKIAFCGYHGSHDWYVAATTRAQGIPAVLSSLALRFEFNRIETLERLFAEHPLEIAGVILEPVQKHQVPQSGFLQDVCDLTRRNGAVVIFDEIVTGFSWALGGAQRFFGVTPDLACFGKGMANGFPLAALVGRRKFMKEMENLFFSMTFGGETVSLAAARATIREFQHHNVVDHIWHQTGNLRDGFNGLAEEYPSARALGSGPVCYFEFRDSSGGQSATLSAIFMQEMVQRGILTTLLPRLSFSHSDRDIVETLEAIEEVLPVIQRASTDLHPEQFLEGRPPKPVFPSGIR